MRAVLLAPIAVLALLAAGCREEASEARPEVTTSEVPGVGNPADVSPINAQTWIDDVTIGHQLATDGSMTTGQGGDDFAPGKPVHISMAVDDAPVGTAVKIVWYAPGETKIAEETKTITTDQKYLTFSAENTRSWKKGDYRAEVWTGDEKVNTQQFQIVDPPKKGK